MIDVDNFKRYNDRFGHPRGDDVLRLVGSALGATVQRREDCLARYGGEEFVALLPGMDLESARDVAELIRVAIEALGIPAAESGCVTVSVGVAALVPADAMPPTDLIVLADAALYAAKHNGRNRVEISELRRPVG
jgi:diguanylate cyclase (GGDEF)-like protein